MKLRIGYVSNSSSSSFLLIDNNNKYSKKEIKEANRIFLLEEYINRWDPTETELKNFKKDSMKRYDNLKGIVVDKIRIDYGFETDILDNLIDSINKKFNLNLILKCEE